MRSRLDAGRVARPIRVLHCPWNIGQNPQMLARAERELGLRSTAVALDVDPFGYRIDEVLFAPEDRFVDRERKRLALLGRAARSFDVVHYNFGQQIFRDDEAGAWRDTLAHRIASVAVPAYRRALHRLELPVLRRLGRGIVVTYQGDDARQGDYCRANFEITHATEVGPEYYPPGSDEEKRREIARFARYADRIYALNPDLLHMLPEQAEFLPYATVDLREWTPAHARPIGDGRLTVLHAPSHRGAKGTRYVLEAVERLRHEDGLDFEFLLVEGMTNAEARRAYERADLLVDQLLIGWYGGLAVELMALGRPVVAYLREGDLRFIPRRMREEMPVVNAHPGTIYEVLKDLLTRRRAELPELGRRSRAYVEAWHDPLEIAARLERDYRAILGRT